jgi:hypothetical protein
MFLVDIVLVCRLPQHSNAHVDMPCKLDFEELVYNHQRHMKNNLFDLSLDLLFPKDMLAEENQDLNTNDQ